MSYFSLGGISIPIECFAEFDQSYEAIEASSIVRMSDGTGIKQTAWSGKLKINTSGSGWIPLGLSGLDFSTALLMQCAKPRAISKASNTILLPASRRTDTDYTPIGFAVVNNQLIETTITIASNTATLGIIPNATAYRVHYWPQINVFVIDPPESWNKTGNHSWSFTAEEI